MPAPKPSLQIILLYLGCVLIWGSSFILMKKGLESFTALEVGAIRMLVAAIALLPLAIRHLSSGKKYPWRLILLSALSGNALPAVLFPLAETQLDSSVAGTLNALTPVFTLVLGVLFFQTPAASIQRVGVTIAFLGSALLIVLSPAGALAGWRTVGYGLIVVLAALLYGYNLNLVKRYLHGLRSTELTSLALLLAGPVGLAYLCFSGFFHKLGSDPHALTSLGYLCILGGMGTAVALILFYRLVQLSSAVFAASNTYFIPFVAIFWGALAGEPISWLHFAGLGIILAGVYLVNKRAKPKTISPDEPVVKDALGCKIP